MSDDDSYYEYAVVERINGEKPEMLPQTYTDEHEANGYMRWVLERNEEYAAAPRDSREWWYWNHGGLKANHVGNRPLKDATYYIVRRRVGPWERV